MKRLIALIGAALLALMVLPASPAHALQGTNFACKAKSGVGYNVRVCAEYGWRMQNDGTGVHFENVRILVSRGCGDLEAQALSGVLVAADGSGGRAIGAQHGCDVTWDIEANGKDVGAAEIQTTGNVNVNNAPDFDFSLTCEVYPSNGTSDCHPFDA